MLKSFYKVNNLVFANKTLALFHANDNGIPISNITWHFNDELLNSSDWSVEPPLSLNDYYTQRARELREKYDYIIVMCSGGADSTNVVYSFLKNGIHIDEIFASAPLSGLSNWVDNINDKSTENTISETKFAQLPFLAEIERDYPKVKITINDYFEDILNYKDTDWLIKSTDFVHPTTVARFNLETTKHLQKLAETNKSVGVIYGIDKPIITIQPDGKITNCIVDVAVNVPMPFDVFGNFHTELFYWGTHPDLMIKQCHILLRWLFLPENKRILDYTILNGRGFISKDFNSGTWQRAIVPCIYPWIEKEIWQAGKPKFNIMSDMDNWFYEKHGKLEIISMMKGNIADILYKLKPEYFSYLNYYNNGKYTNYKSGLKSFFKTFYIGEANEFKKIIN
jgi:hypothetical protein